MNRTLARCTAQDKPIAPRLTGAVDELARRSVAATRRLAHRLRERAVGRGSCAKLAAARRLD